MKWTVIDSLISPSTGTAFSCIISYRELKLIIWYKSSDFMMPGDEIITSDLGVFINGQISYLTMCNVIPFNASLWRTMLAQSECPGNAEIKPTQCNFNGKCRLKKCPFGLEKNLPGLFP
ncbi:anti-adapter protein IraM [Enterobacteriaceae bacterium H20N1]|uniref:Anti-adapter protein IraM n=1 Tax=Dryocola boscaweniae TaxID=2925397 RepID=A0A9X2W936_9ENTR|nr:anti-adapter protein IraM [Dryocola boscaweniae]MCT4703110.1 anti-adapter protein IraM [Dryocola boscaweniae]MCT4720278.1 anti-adapter protein IraM [Dryocola boscaweniae]